MGFFQKIKLWLGFGGVSVTCKVPGQISKDDGKVKGTMVLTTKSEMQIQEVSAKLEEKYTTGRGSDKKTKTYTLGEHEEKMTFTIKPGETKEIPFEFDFVLLKSNNESLAEKGGVLGGLGKAGKFLNNEKSSFQVVVSVDCVGVGLDPNDIVDVNLV